MPNTIACAERYTANLDKALVQKPVTGFFTDNALRAKFIGSNVVQIPDVDMQGLGDYDRDTGFVKGTVSVSHTPYELKMDRGRSFSLDAQDVDESGVADLAGEVLGEFMRTKVAPEVDAYVLSKLAALAKTKGHTITGSGALEKLTNGIMAVQEKAGYDEELVCFVSSDRWAEICNSTEIQKHITVNQFSKGGVDTAVKCYNGVPILPVPAERMFSMYTFFDGHTATQEKGGFEPLNPSETIKMLVLPKRAASLVKKVENTRMFSPKENLDADAWKIDVRLYYDLFVKKSMENNIFADIHTANG